MDLLTDTQSRCGVILLATINEDMTIDSVLQEIAESCGSLERFGWKLTVLVVDDGPEFGFLGYCEELGEKYGIVVRALTGPHSGLGAAILYGFEQALIDPEVEFVINLDADGQHDARQIGDLLRAHITTAADITIGSRWTQGGRCYGLSTQRKIISRVSALALHFAGVPWFVKDPTTSFRVYSRLSIRLMTRDLVGFSGFSFFGAAIAHADRNSMQIIEVPILFRPRLSGNSNLRIKQIWRAIRDLPSIRSTSKMVHRRNSEFLGAHHGQLGPDQYNASRELEVLSSTPVSTAIIVNELQPFLGEKVLEVGAGIGQISNQIQRSGRLIVSIEPDGTLFDTLRKSSDITGHIFLNGTLQTVIASGDLNSQLFDSILYVNVLEHIEDDIEELKLASSLLTPNGNIVIFVPALPSLYGTMDSVSGHFRRYRKNELIACINAANLETKSIYSFDLIGIFPYWFLYRFLSIKNLGTGSVFLYDRIVVPTSLLFLKITKRRVTGKNLIAVANLRNIEGI